MNLSERELERILQQDGYELVNEPARSKPARKPQRAQKGPKATKAPGRKSGLAESFESLWALYDGPTLKPEHVFHGERDWRFDYCHMPTQIAIELEGGVYQKRYYKDGRFAGYGGRHMTPDGFVKDCTKYLEAHLLGYTVMRLATGMVTPENVQRIIAHIRSIEASRP